jgi:hypothetical protein
MKYFLLVSFLLGVFSCSKHLNNSDHIETIIHHGGLDEDTLHYHYDANGQISNIENGLLKFHYIYENNRIILRNLFKNLTLLESDSISYDANGNISRFIAHRFANGTFPAERDQADFTYQDHKLIAARSQFVDQSIPYDVFAEYTWTGGNMTKIILRYWPIDSTNLLFTYSAAVNPYAIFGQQVWLLDPGFDFTRFGNLQRIAYLCSAQCAVGVEEYLDGNYFGAQTVEMRTNRDNKIAIFQISPTDEVIEYHYGRPGD